MILNWVASSGGSVPGSPAKTEPLYLIKKAFYYKVSICITVNWES